MHGLCIVAIFGFLSLLSSPAPAFVDEWNSVPCVMYYPAVGAARRSNCDGNRIRFGSAGQVSYNSLGLPDRDYPLKAETGTIRVLLIGGSVWAGSGVNQSEAIPRRFEEELRGLGVPKLEVINATTEGFSAWQNAILLPEFLRAYSPHLVLFHEFAMYPFQELSEWNRLMMDGNGWPLRYTPWTDELPGWLRDRLARGTNWLHMANGTFLEWSRILRSWEIAGASSESERLERLLGPTYTALNMMLAASRAHGAKFAVVIDGDDFTSRQLLVRGAHLYTLAAFSRSLILRNFKFPASLVKAKLEERKFRVISLEDGISERAGKVIAGDYHWTAEGSAIYARQMARASLSEVKNAH